MKSLKKFFYILMSLLILVPFLSKINVSASTITYADAFPDTNLQKIILNTLEIDSKDEAIDTNKLASIKKLLADNAGIHSIEGLQYCTNLNYLSIAYNNIEDLSPINNSTSLVMLHIEGNNLYDLDELTNLPNLKFLNASNNNISNISPLRNFKSLGSLYLFNNRIREAYSLSGLPLLHELDLAYNNISNFNY